jgi:Fic family protein
MPRRYIHNLKNWTDFRWDDAAIIKPLTEALDLRGRLFGRMDHLGFASKEEALLATLTEDIVKSSEIEGEHLNEEQVRSSIARRLGIDSAGLVSSDRNIDGIVEMTLDATQRYEIPLAHERLFGWHAALFPTGYSGPHKIEVASYRTQPVYVVSGALGKEKTHYEGPDASRVRGEMDSFIEWFNSDNDSESTIKAAIAHIRFVLIHPFEDGNGRIARAISDMQLARSDRSPNRYYSMSERILAERSDYYKAIQTVSTGKGDLTQWLLWFISCLNHAIEHSDELLDDVLRKARFRERARNETLNDRQQKMLELLLGDFQGKLTTSKWARIAKTSDDTALRDINDLITKGLLKKSEARGRSAHYEIITT